MNKSIPTSNIEKIRQDIINDAGRCVLCGMCSTSCPTYQIARNENESPRGRIALLQGVARRQLDATAELKTHIEQCIGCRTCEAVCPSQVNFGRIIARGKTLINQETSTFSVSSSRKTLFRLATRSRAFSFFAAKALWFYQATGLRNLLRDSRLLKFSGLSRWDNYLPTVSFHSGWDEYYPAHVNEKGQVALFTGCVTHYLDRPVYAAAIRVLNRYGISVHIPKQQTCCGALPLNNGYLDEAQECFATNTQVFGKLRVSAVLYGSAGCGTTLKEYDQWLQPSETKSEQTPSRRIASRVQDVTEYLVAIPSLSQLDIRPLYKTVAVHTPCLQRTVLKNTQITAQLLKNVRGIKLVNLAGSSCCGAGGAHMLTHPDLAEKVRDPIIENIRQLNPDVVVTTNMGCALHLEAGLRKAGLAIPVKHPVVLFDEQLP